MRYLLARLTNMWSRLTRRRPTLVPPPQEALSIGIGDFVETGEHSVDLLVNLADAIPQSRILEIGCGIGRAATRLVGVLDRTGEYLGFDVQSQAIRWCRENISSSYPNFSFEHIDLYNATFNLGGAVNPTTFQFPRPSGSVDIVCAFSVFTHLDSATARRYLQETSRVLRPGGRALATFFILPQGSFPAAAIHELRSGDVPGEYFVHVERRDPGVAFDEATLRQMFAEAGLELIEPIFHGAWRGEPDTLSYQDVILAAKPLDDPNSKPLATSQGRRVCLTATAGAAAAGWETVFVSEDSSNLSALLPRRGIASLYLDRIIERLPPGAALELLRCARRVTVHDARVFVSTMDQFLYSEAALSELLRSAGFSEVIRSEVGAVPVELRSEGLLVMTASGRTSARPFPQPRAVDRAK